MPGTIIYDGECPFCKKVVSFIRRKDKNGYFRFAPSQSQEGSLMVSKANLPPKDTNTVIYFTEEKSFIRSTAVLKILRELGGGWRIFYPFIIIPESIRDYFYRLIARNRYRFFK
jgi:predicted DCC family thiol-disulfide oxidoreductase YuxK